MDMDLVSHIMVLVLPIATVVSKAYHITLAREKLKLRLTMVSTDMALVLPTILTVLPTVM